MSYMEIEGGTPLQGSVKISGNKNAALPAIACCLLTDQEVILENMPDILDVRHMLELIEDLGCRVERDGDNVLIDSSGLNSSDIPEEHCRRVRTSILFAAPLLHRFGKTEIHMPGGDVIGRRRLDTHIYGLERLGAIYELSNSFRFHFPKDKTFQAADLFFDEASVTATEHILMAAAVAEGETIIRNCASEPHVQDVANLLVAMGAEISGIGTNQLHVKGKAQLNGARFRIGYDHIEAASFLSIAAATGGEITVEGVQRGNFWMPRRVFERLGINIVLNEDSIYLPSNQKRTIQEDLGGGLPVIDDGPWPQFPSDMMSCMIVLATQVNGTVLFFEKMFESRLFFVDRLVAMGANAVLCDPHRVVITGPRQLRPTRLHSPDIRAGMALLGAGLCANGKSTIENVGMIDRGYQNIVGKLEGLGAKVKRFD